MAIRPSGIVFFLRFVDCTVFEELLSLLCSEDLTRLGLTASLLGGALKHALHLQDRLLDAIWDEDLFDVRIALDNGAHPSGWGPCWSHGSAFSKVVEEIFLASLDPIDAVAHEWQMMRFAILGLLVDYGLHSFVSPPLTSDTYHTLLDGYRPSSSSPFFGMCDCHSIVSLLARNLRLHSMNISSSPGGEPFTPRQQRFTQHEVLTTLRHLLTFLAGAALTHGSSFRRNLLRSLQEGYFDAMMRLHGFPDAFVDVAYLHRLKDVINLSRETLVWMTAGA